jgi:prolyl oligopeptidase
MTGFEKAKRRAGRPVKAKRGRTRDSYHGVSVPDPYRALEDLDAPATKAFVDAQNQRFERYISGHARRAVMETRLKGALDYPRTGMPSRFGRLWFDSFNPGLAPQSVLRVRDTRDGPPRVLIDPNTLSSDGTVALSGTSISPNGKYVAYLVSEKGSDAQTLRIRDIATGRDLPDVIPNCRFTGITWDKDSDDAFSYTYPAGDALKRRVLKHHRLGDDPAGDPMIFEVPGQANSFAGLSRPRLGDYDYVYTGVGTNPNRGLWRRKTGDTGPFTKLFDGGVASYSVLGETGGYIYLETDRDAPRGKLVRFKADNPDPAGWETIIPEHSADLLQGAFIHKGWLYVSHSVDCADKFCIHSLDGAKLGDIALPPQSVYGLSRINEEDDSFLLSISDFLRSGDIHEYDINSGLMSLFRKSGAPTDLTDCIVERLHAVSKDGTKVPMTVIRHPRTRLDGTAALKLYGYGGFNVPLGPGYSTEIMNWVREGGIYVQANLRGGGEFGSDWYDQGRLLKKQNVFDDFIACAAHLQTQGYTSPARTVIEGGSNGGLLTLACMLQRPGLFGAVISSVPVTDMLRFDKHTYGAAWKSDYGDPTNSAEDFKAAMGYSPLHNVKPGRRYSTCLVKTADHDDRVVPSHAFKFVATMLSTAAPDSLTLMRVETGAGHGAGKPIDKAIQEMLDTHAFIENSIGPINQADYKFNLSGRRKPRRPRKDAKPPV